MFPLSAQWTKLPNIEGGDVIKWAYDSNQIVALTNNGAFHWDEANTTWIRKTNNITYLTGFCRIGNSYFTADNSLIHQGKNYGQSWENISANIYKYLPQGSFFISDFKSYGNTIYLTTQTRNADSCNALLASDDLGKTWKKFHGVFDSANLLRMVKTDNALFVQTNNKGIYRSQNGGQTWTAVNKGLPQIYAFLSDLRAARNILFTQYLDTLFYSVNQGDQWQPIVRDYNIYPMVKWDVSDSVIAYLSYDSLLLSTDTGKTWTASAGPSVNGITDFAITPGYFLMGSNKGITGTAKSTINWQPMQKDYYGGIIYPLVKKDTLIYSLFSGELYASADNGTSWKPAGKGLTGLSLSRLKMGNNNLFVTNSTRRFYHTLPDSDSFIINQPAGLGNSSLRIYDIVAKDSMIALCTNRGIGISSDTGKTWKFRNKGFTDTTRFRSLFIAGNMLVVSGASATFTTVNWGLNWKKFTSISDTMNARNVAEIDNYVYLFGNINGRNGGAYRSDNQGQTWTKVSALDNYAVQLMKINGKYYQFSQNIGVQVSSDSLKTWKSANFGLLHTWFNGTKGTFVLSAYAFDTTIFVNDGDGLLCRSDLSTIIRAAGVSQAKIRTQCIAFPNPASHTIEVQTIQKNGTALLMDLNGKEIQKQNISAGRALFHISRIPDGVYLIGVEHPGNLQAFRKILICK
ncbi:MAG: T9SS type A sorting domain-containing protein [Bacteroidetes bacterium]|nr:T9SS type A sorting domain-containing protein [Bacteroidota bacterium]